MADNSEKRHQAICMEEREEYEEISMVQIQEHKNETKMHYEIKMEGEGKRLNDELTGKLENHQRQIEGIQEIKNNLSTRYQLTSKQQSGVNKIEKNYNKKIKKVEKNCAIKMKKKLTKNKPNLDVKLQQLMEEKKYIIRKNERECNKKLYQLEDKWIKKNKLKVAPTE